MMNKRIYLSFILAGLSLFSSCAQKSSSTMDENTQNMTPTAEAIPSPTSVSLAQEPAGDESTPAVFFQTDSRIRSAILAAEGTLYFGNENREFIAVDIVSRQELWRYSPDASVQTWPVYSDGKVLFNAGNSLYILNAISGEEIFKVSPTASSTKRVTSYSYAYHDSYTAVIDDTAYFVTLDGDLVAVDIESGKILWTVKAEFPGAVASGVSAWNGKLYYVDCGEYLRCVDAQTSKTLFQTKVDDLIYAPIYIDSGKLYIAGRNCMVSCIDADKGDILWSSFSNNKTTWFSGGSVSVGDTLYTCTSDEHTLNAYDENTGELLLSYPTVTNAYTQPLLHGENVIVAASDVYTFNHSVITEFDTQNQKELWQISIDDCVLSAPSIYQGMLYFGSDSGAVYSIKLK